MNRSKLQEFLTHPALLSLLVWILLVVSIPVNFQKFRITHIRDEYTGEVVNYLYYDLDDDGNSEEISFDLADEKQTKIIVNRNGRTIDQYNLRYHTGTLGSVGFYDYNNDQKKEIYAFTTSDDSIFLNIIDPVASGKVIVSGRFIDFRRIDPNSDNKPFIMPIGLLKQPGNYNDFIFLITTGYSRRPRSIYSYSVISDSLVKSPPGGAVISEATLFKTNGRQLIMPDVQATGNLDENDPFTDLHAWLMVLDENLKFLFDPVMIGNYPSKLYTLPVTYRGLPEILVYYNYFGPDSLSSFLGLYDLEGRRLSYEATDNYETGVVRIFPAPDSTEEKFFFLKDHNSVVEMDYSFNRVHDINIPGVVSADQVAVVDADMDGHTERMFAGINLKSLLIFRDNFKFPVEYTTPAVPLNVTQYLQKGKKPELYAQFPGVGSFIRYERNPLYFAKYPFYPVTFLAIYFLVMLIAHAQRIRLNARKENEQRLAALQMKAIKNQIDPHFTLNVLNAIGSLYSDDKNRDRADYLFGKYARLIRQTVMTSDQVVVNLEEELDFVKNYIEIEKFRSGSSFEYSIEIGEGTDLKTKIPRTLIHTFVENSIKYGLRRRAHGGILKVIIQRSGGDTVVTVGDNGPDTADHSKDETGTGKGLVILNDLIGLYFRLENVRITYELQREANPENGATLTRAVIRIPVIPGRPPK